MLELFKFLLSHLSRGLHNTPPPPNKKKKKKKKEYCFNTFTNELKKEPFITKKG